MMFRFNSNISRLAGYPLYQRRVILSSSLYLSRSLCSTSNVPYIASNIDQFFNSSKSPSINHQKLQNYLNLNKSHLYPSDVAYLLARTSKSNLKLSPVALTSLTECLSQNYHSVNQSEFAQIFFSLKDYDNNTPEITNLRGVLVKIINTPKFRDTTVRFNARSLGMCFYGLKNMNYEMKYVAQLVQYLVQSFKETSDGFSLRTLCHLLRGLTGLKEDHPLTKELLAIVYTKLIICNSNDLLETKDVVNIYRSFQSLSMRSDEVSSFMRELLVHIDRFHHYMTTSGSKYRGFEQRPFTPGDLVNMYRGIARFDIRCNETISLYSYLSHWLQSPSTPLTKTDIAAILFSLKDHNKAGSTLNETLIYLCENLLKLTQFNPDGKIAKTPLSFDEITLILPSLAILSPISRHSNTSLRNLVPLISSSLSAHHGVLSSNDVYRLFVAASFLTSSLPEDRELFLLLGERLQDPSVDISPKALRAIVNSLRHMDSEFVETRKFLILLTEKLQKLPDLKIGEKWGCIYGLQSLSSNDPIVRSFLKVLTSRFIPYPPSYRFTPQSVGCAIFGLQSLHPTHAEVRDLLQIMIKDYQSMTIGLDEQAVSNIFYGIQNLHDQSIPESEHLVRILIDILKRNQHQLRISAHGISQLMVGIQKFSSNDSNTQQLLEIVTTYLANSRDILHYSILIACLTSLRNFSLGVPQVEAFFTILMQKVQQMSQDRKANPLTASQIVHLLNSFPLNFAPSTSLVPFFQYLDDRLGQLPSKQQINAVDFLSCLRAMHHFSFHDTPLISSILRHLLSHTIEVPIPYTLTEYGEYLQALSSFPTDHILTIDLMYYLIQRLPSSQLSLPRRIGSQTILGIVKGLKKKNPQLLETKVIFQHALEVIEVGNRYLGRSSASVLMSGEDPVAEDIAFDEPILVELCEHLSQFDIISEEYRKLLRLLADTINLHHPEISARGKVVIENFFVTREELRESSEEVERLLEIVQGLPERKE